MHWAKLRRTVKNVERLSPSLAGAGLGRVGYGYLIRKSSCGSELRLKRIPNSEVEGKSAQVHIKSGGRVVDREGQITPNDKALDIHSQSSTGTNTKLLVKAGGKLTSR